MGSDHRSVRGEIGKLLLAKQRRRREMAGLPIERKIRILVSLQEMAAGLRRRAGGTSRRPWAI